MWRVVITKQTTCARKAIGIPRGNAYECRVLDTGICRGGIGVSGSQLTVTRSPSHLSDQSLDRLSRNRVAADSIWVATLEDGNQRHQ